MFSFKSKNKVNPVNDADENEDESKAK